MSVRAFAAILTAIAAIVPANHGHSATVVYDSGGFEPPRFTASENLQGQDAPPSGDGPWRKDSGVSTGRVQDNVVSAGLQAVRISRVASPNGDTRWGLIKPITPTPSQSIITIDVDLRVEEASGLSFGPAFGIECYDSSVGAPKLIGSVTVDATTGDVLYQRAGLGVLLQTGSVVAFGIFHHFTFAADFSTMTYSIFLDEELLQTEPFVDNTAVRFTDAPLVTFAATADTLATATGTAYFDNYVISTIPEPGVISLILAGATMLRRTQRP